MKSNIFLAVSAVIALILVNKCNPVTAGLAPVCFPLKLSINFVEQPVQRTLVRICRRKILLAVIAEPLLDIRRPYQRLTALIARRLLRRVWHNIKRYR
jgi:hypothetical protein